MRSDLPDGTPFHLSHEQLLCLVDGELPAGDRDAARDHLDRCADCSARMARVEQLSTALAGTYRQEVRRSRAAKVCAALVTAVCSLYWLAAHESPARSTSTMSSLQLNALPVTYLTPGATRAITTAELCAANHEASRREIPASVRRVVLHNYGAGGLSDREYELDYLITPELGGLEDARNLWPEQYASPTWNARVKDDLERLLRELVCSGNLALSAAQRDIATNWIAAYKHYFHTARPGGWPAALPQPVPLRD